MYTSLEVNNSEEALRTDALPKVVRPRLSVISTNDSISTVVEYRFVPTEVSTVVTRSLVRQIGAMDGTKFLSHAPSLP